MVIYSPETSESVIARLLADLPRSASDHLAAARITHTPDAIIIRAANPQSAAWMKVKLLGRLRYDIRLYTQSSMEVVVE